MSATANIILDTRRVKERTQKYPVKLRIIYRGVPKDFQTIYDLTEDQFESLSAKRVSEELKETRTILKNLKADAELAIRKIDPFEISELKRTFIQSNSCFRERKIRKGQEEYIPFEFDYTPYQKRFKLLSETHPTQKSISVFYQRYVQKLLQEERIGSALNYQESYNSLKKFRGNLPITDINVSYLVQYEQWMKKRNCQRATIGIKLRALRSIFNEAIHLEAINKERYYPFGKRKYIIPTSKNVKKALSREDVNKLYFAQIETPDEEKARDFWFFLYFGNGMNPKDFCYLKYKNIQGEFIVFVRAKTENTTRQDPRPISVFVNEDMQRIMNKWGNPNKDPDQYIFPYMEETATPLFQYYIIKNLLKYINDHMKKIAGREGMERMPTTIVSRHTFSTQLKRAGVSTEFIQEALGHTDKKTTENYLDSFESHVKKDIAGLLNGFKESIQKVEPHDDPEVVIAS